jgi:hypothetical protein
LMLPSVSPAEPLAEGDQAKDLVRRVRFDDLPAAVRERFFACADGRAEPRPIVAATYEPRTGTYTALAVGCAIILGSLLWFGWGIDPTSEHLDGGAWVTASYAPIVLAFAAATMAALRERARGTALPWRAGRYLFPAAFIDANSAELRIMPITRLRSIREVVRTRDRGSLVMLHFEAPAVRDRSER